MNVAQTAASAKRTAGAILKYRICYQKNDALIFISHLDLQTTFQRAFRRAQIDLAFSEGFNPHPKMTYSPPLPLFVSSAQEYIDVELQTQLTDQEIFDRLNAKLPSSLVLNSAKALRGDEAALPELIVWGEYAIELHQSNLPENICQIVEDFYCLSSQIVIKKRNKKKQFVDKDIKPLMRYLKCKKIENGICVTCSLSLVNDTLLNPTYVTKFLTEQIESLKSAVVSSIRTTKVSGNI